MKQFVVLIITYLPFFSFSCTCLGENSVKQELKNSSNVFLGTAISVKEIIIDDNPKYSKGSHIEYKYSFLVKKRYKGKESFDTLEIITPSPDGECGITFQIGNDYIVYGRKDKLYANNIRFIFLTSNSCSRTKLYNQREENEILHFVRRKNRIH